MDRQYEFWNQAFAGSQYYYGFEPGPVARRAVRYHRPLWPKAASPTALDAGCGEGQDLVYLAREGYAATGLDFTANGAEKARQLLQNQQQQAQIQVADLREYSFTEKYDLVLAVNVLQFLGEATLDCLTRILGAVQPNGVLGLSVFAREEKEAALRDGVYYFSGAELLSNFDHLGPNRQWQMLETTRLSQWNRAANQPQPFLTLIAQAL